MMRVQSGIPSRISPLHPLNRAQPAGPSAPGQSSPEISATGHLFLTGQRALANLPAVRGDQVTQFQSLLSTGAYRVNGEACAAAMLPVEGVVNNA